MSTAAAMTSSSGSSPNIIVGHATTPESIEIAASSPGAAEDLAEPGADEPLASAG